MPKRTNVCALPYCDERTMGKQVRGVNFCLIHRELALTLRDDTEIKERLGKRNLRGDSFVSLLKAYILSPKDLEGILSIFTNSLRTAPR
jgi:hypothetical protein